MSEINGVINVLKPPGMTSFDVVGYLRKVFNIKKIGHTGTLDPNAAGVLPVCIGKATKAIEFMVDKTKSYRAEMVIGIETDTQDLTGNIINTYTNIPDKQDIINTMLSFIGTYDQTPPMYSAVKIDGVKMYELARKGIEVERKARKVTISDLKIISLKRNDNNTKVLFDVTCSKGTYIRTLCYDIGKKLGVGACMSFLLRTGSGPYKIENSNTIEEIKSLYTQKRFKDFVDPIETVFSEYDSYTLSSKDFYLFKNGVKIEKELDSKKINKKFKIYNNNNEFVAIGELKQNNKKMALVNVKRFM